MTMLEDLTNILMFLFLGKDIFWNMNMYLQKSKTIQVCESKF